MKSLIWKVFKYKINELAGIDIRSLAALRIAIGILVILDLILRSRDLEAFYTDSGILPRTLLISKYISQWNISIHLINGNIYSQQILFIIEGIFAVCFLIGFKTRLTNIIVWFLYSSLHLRNPLILYGGDGVIRLLLFWSMFLPMNAKWSIDSIKRPDLFKYPQKILSVATLAVLIQPALVYIFTALLKSGTEWHGDGTAIYKALINDQAALPFGIFLSQFPNLLKLLTYYVWWLESIGPFFLFFPIFTGQIRIIVIILFCSLQLGIGSSLRLELFPWISCAMMIIYLPGSFWNYVHLKFYKPNSLIRKLNNNIYTLAKEIPLQQFYTYQKSVFIKDSLILPIIYNLAVGLFLIYVLAYNLNNVKPFIKIPVHAYNLGRILNINQRWGMYTILSNTPAWTEIVGRLANDTFIDLKGDKPIKSTDFTKPKIISKTYKSARWLFYIARLPGPDLNIKCIYLSHYLCNNWNKEHLGENALKEIEIFIVKENALETSESNRYEKVSLYKSECR